MDMDEQARLRAQAPQTYVRVEQGQPLSVADVKALAQARLSDDVIISQIRNSRTVYHLGVSDIIDLKNSGVSERVIDYMINTATATGGAAAVAAPMPAGPAVVEAAPPPAPVETVLVSPGPGYVWVGGEWVWNGGWVWVGGHWVLPPYPHAVWVGGYWGRGPRGWYHFAGSLAVIPGRASANRRSKQNQRSLTTAFFSPSLITCGFQDLAWAASTSVKLIMVSRSPGLPSRAVAPFSTICPEPGSAGIA